MKLSFRRITSSNSFIPEIDGLRFIAISSVILFHLYNFIRVKDLNQYLDNTNYSVIKNILYTGHLGVPLFFIISGFILGFPFAKFHLSNGNRVNLKKFFLKRLTRLEPPYIITMTILLVGAVYIAKTISLHEGIISYFASLIYIHNFVFPGEYPKINVVAWSLEIEVQFYILAPLIAYLFAIKPNLIRRIIIITITAIFLVINNFDLNPFNFVSLINYIQYFLIGFLLVDLYISNSKIFPNTKLDSLLGLFFFVLIWTFDDKNLNSNTYKFILEVLRLTSMFLFYYYVLFHKIFKFLSLNFITNIGGMCYSIYLLHYPIISLFGNHILKFSFSNYSFINITIYSIILIVLIMIICSIFFLLIERPCMDNNWYKKIFRKTNKEQNIS